MQHRKFPVRIGYIDSISAAQLNAIQNVRTAMNNSNAIQPYLLSSRLTQFTLHVEKNREALSYPHSTPLNNCKGEIKSFQNHSTQIFSQISHLQLNCSPKNSTQQTTNQSREQEFLFRSIVVIIPNPQHYLPSFQHEFLYKH